MTFRADFYAAGWQNVIDPKEHNCMTALYMGAQCVARKGPVRVHLVWAVMYDHEGRVSFCDPAGERPMSICALVTDPCLRGKGFAREALRELVALARKHGFTHVFLEPHAMNRKFKPPMKSDKLAAWYKREGFIFKKNSTKVMEIEFKG